LPTPLRSSGTRLPARPGSDPDRNIDLRRGAKVLSESHGWHTTRRQTPAPWPRYVVLFSCRPPSGSPLTAPCAFGIANGSGPTFGACENPRASSAKLKNEPRLLAASHLDGGEDPGFRRRDVIGPDFFKGQVCLPAKKRVARLPQNPTCWNSQRSVLRPSASWRVRRFPADNCRGRRLTGGTISNGDVGSVQLCGHGFLLAFAAQNRSIWHHSFGTC